MAKKAPKKTKAKKLTPEQKQKLATQLLKQVNNLEKKLAVEEKRWQKTEKSYQTEIFKLEKQLDKLGEKTVKAAPEPDANRNGEDISEAETEEGNAGEDEEGEE